MTEKPIVVGVDASDEAVKAAALGARIAEKIGSTCHLVHAVRDNWSVAAEEIPFDLALYNEQVLDAKRAAVETAMERGVSIEVLETLDTRLGRAQPVLKEVVEEIDAGLIVMGGKHHPRLERWLSGSTVHQVLRTLDLPMLITGPGSTDFKKILAAVDLSHAAGPTIRAAEEFADLFDAQLWAFHAVDSLHGTSMVPLPFDHEELVEKSTNRLEAEVWPMIYRPGTERLVRSGHAAEAIIEEVSAWGAGLVVLGSHGKGLTERVLLGSTTERLLNNLPTALLVIPVHDG
jgi:nucleotide-binding universal stress UspA family protein